MTYDTLVTEEEARRGERRSWLPFCIILTTLLACAYGLSRNDADPDLWGHVQFGRDALQYGLPETTTYSYTADGYRWINHEVAAEYFFALTVNWIGPTGLLAFKCMLGVLIIGMMMARASRMSLRLTSVCFMALIVAANLAPYWAVRPQLFSYFYFALMLLILSWAFEGWEGRWWFPWSCAHYGSPSTHTRRNHLQALWLAVPLFLFWANTHGGFVAGLCVFLAYLSIRCIEAFCCRDDNAWKCAGMTALVGAASVAASCVNPYGLDLHMWLIESLTIPRPEITEWHPPDLLHLTSLRLWLLLACWFICLIFSRRQRDLTHLVVMTLILWQALSHERHIPFFALVLGFWLPPHVDSVLDRVLGISRPVEEKPSVWTYVTCGFVVSLVIVVLSGQLRQMNVDRSHYPVSAMEYMARHDLNGKMVVTYNWAEYVIAARGSRHEKDEGVQVGFDGRFRTSYPQAVVDMHFDLLLGNPRRLRFRGEDSPAFDPKRILAFKQPDLVLISRKQVHSTEVLDLCRPNWVLLYQDELSQLWGCKKRFGTPGSPDYLPPSRRDVTNRRQRGHVAWPAIPASSTHASRDQKATRHEG